MGLKTLVWAAALICGTAAQAETPTLAVTGSGEVAVAPDMARIDMGVIAEARTAQEAVAAMSEDLSAVLMRLEGAGITGADVQTSGLSVSPRYDGSYSSGGDRISGYIASSTVTATIRDLDTLGETLDAVISDGANQMNGLRFDVADRAPLEDTARRRAVTDAADKAAVLADAAGLELGGIRLLREGGGGRVGPEPMMEMAMTRSAVPVAEGEITIRATVYMEYAIAP